MKRLVILTMVVVMVVLMGISEEALAGPWTGSAFAMSQTYSGCGYCGYSGSAFRMTRIGYGWYGGYGGYAYGRDRTLGRIAGYGGLAMNVLGTISQISANDRMLSMAEREQEFRHSQVVNQAQAQKETVLVTRGPIVYQVPVVYQVKKEPEETQKNEELQQKIRILELELEKLKLQQELEKAKK